MASQGLGSLAGYAMSESDGEDDFHGKLSGNISGSDDEQSNHSQAPSRTYSPVIRDEEPPAKKKPAAASSLGLVSYGGHEEDSDTEMKHSDNEDEKSPAAESLTSFPKNTQDIEEAQERVAEEPGSASESSPTNREKSPSDEVADDIVIPPSPPGRCSNSLVEKVQRMQRGRVNLDTKIQSSKEFRNPSIYEKLLSHVGINEKGTNYPPELFDPSIWDKTSFYDELAKAQNSEMEKRKNEKKDRVKVDFITATKTDSDSAAQRKSKWDTGAPQSKPGAPPAVGSLIKRK